ncbi:MAG: hypothetical protein M3122_04820 [Actinomycetota bacterium]|nr:hypothetical protein [Actinomycetota bacterium]
MSAGADGAMALQTVRDGLRRLLLIFASSATVFSVLHHVDHVTRGNHSGWPFQAEVTPFTFSLLIYILILPAIYLTARGHDVAGYHLFVAVTGLVLLGTVHFAPTGVQESPIHDIYMVYESPVAGTLALVILTGLITSVALLAITAFTTLRRRARDTEGD